MKNKYYINIDIIKFWNLLITKGYPNLNYDRLISIGKNIEYDFYNKKLEPDSVYRILHCSYSNIGPEDFEIELPLKEFCTFKESECIK